MKRSTKISIIKSTSLLSFRGITRWILGAVTRICRDYKVVIISFNTSIKKNLSLNAILLEIMRQLSECEGNVSWHELPRLSYDETRLTPFGRLLSNMIIPLGFNISYIRKSYVYMIAGTRILSILSLILLTLINGASHLVVGIHTRLTNYKKFFIVKPIFKILYILGVLRGIHTVNVVDAVALRKVLGIPVWWIPNGVDCDKFKPGIKHDKFQVLFVGALDEIKGVDTFIKIAETIRGEYDDINFIVAGDGILRKLVEDAHEKGIVRFLGFVPHNELARLYAESHVVVLPSREEAFGLVSLEAQASGTPVIATDIPAFRQTVINGVTGFLVKPYTPEAFVEAIMRVRDMWINHRDRYMEMVVNARRNAEQYCWERVVDVLLRKLLNA